MFLAYVYQNYMIDTYSSVKNIVEQETAISIEGMYNNDTEKHIYEQKNIDKIFLCYKIVLSG